MPLPLLVLLDRWRAPPPATGRIAWIGAYTYAHRGLHGNGVPENSPAAFAAAIERGLGIECDVQGTGDGQAVVFHDWELDRLTSESGAVEARTSRQLAATTLSGSEDRIPTFRQFLDQVAGSVPILIEVKSRKGLRVHRLCRTVHRELEGYRGHHAVMSFDPRVSRWFARHSPETVRGLVVTEEGTRTFGGSIRRHMALWHARPDFLAYDIRDLPSRFAAMQRTRGMAVTTWTVRDAEQMARAKDWADAPIAEGAGLGLPA